MGGCGRYAEAAEGFCDLGECVSWRLRESVKVGLEGGLRCDVIEVVREYNGKKVKWVW